MTVNQLEKLQFHLEGTCQTLVEALCSLNYDEDVNEVEDKLLDGVHPVEQCLECAWWFACGDLARENEEDCGYCEQCRPDEE